MSTIKLIGETYISGNNYIAFKGIGLTKKWVDQYFDKHTVKELKDYSEIFFQPDSNHKNSGSIHLEITYSELMNLGCNYIQIYNETIFEDPNRTYYLYIQGAEQVNANSCRVYFSVDWVASFWDQINLKESNIVRRTEKLPSDIFNFGSYDSEYTNQTPEPIDFPKVRSKFKIRSVGQGNLNRTLEDLTLGINQLNAINFQSSINTNGEFTDPKIIYQMGGSVGGFLYPFYIENGTSSAEAEAFLKKQVSFQKSAFQWGNPVLANISDIYVCPAFVSYYTDLPSDGTPIPDQTIDDGYFDNLKEASLASNNKPLVLNDTIIFPGINDFNKRIKENYGLDLKLRHRKLMNYISYSLISANQSLDFSPFSFKNYRHSDDVESQSFNKLGEIYYRFVGTHAGYFEVGFRLTGFETDSTISGLSISTSNWPTVGVSGTQTGSVDWGKSIMNLLKGSINSLAGGLNISKYMFKDK